MNVRCAIGGEKCMLTATFERGGSPKGAKYTVSRDGEKIGAIIRYPDGKYGPDGKCSLSQEDIYSIGAAIDELNNNGLRP
ncbi:MAG TPA: hypothetical protein VHE59_06900 [Mucilaginibacter sp.]|nr:hypothetical protein [Mucilaginibacter sp.]